MEKKRLIRLVNDERSLLSIRKAPACDGTAVDGGCKYYDIPCTFYAYDEPCDIDMKGCSFGADDYCYGEKDTRDCSGAGEHDYY